MGAFKQANKILLVAVAVALVLVIAAIIILAVTLGKTSNLSKTICTRRTNIKPRKG